MDRQELEEKANVAGLKMLGDYKSTHAFEALTAAEVEEMAFKVFRLGFVIGYKQRCYENR